MQQPGPTSNFPALKRSECASEAAQSRAGFNQAEYEWSSRKKEARRAAERAQCKPLCALTAWRGGCCHQSHCKRWQEDNDATTRSDATDDMNSAKHSCTAVYAIEASILRCEPGGDHRRCWTR